MLETSKLYETVAKMDAPENTKKGIVGLIEFQTNSGIQKVLDKMDAMETRLESKINTNKAELESKINVTNIIAITVGVAILAGSVLNFLSRK